MLVGVGGVAAAVLLILLLASLYASVSARYSAWVDHLDADLVLTTGGMDNAFVGTSRVSPRTVEQIARIPGVASATGILARPGSLLVKGQPQGVYFVGFDPASGAGGPWQMEQGTARIGPEELVLDGDLARANGLKVGDRLDLAGASFRVAGLSAGTHTGFGYIFVDRAQGARLFGVSDAYHLILIKAADRRRAQDLAQRLSGSVPDATAYTRSQFASNTVGVFDDSALPALRLMATFAFLIGAAIIGLTVYTAVVEKVRDYALMKALGAGALRLYRLVLAQALLVALAGFLLGGLATFLIALILNRVAPRAAIAFEPLAVLAALFLALLMALVGSWPPAQRVLRDDPVLVLRS
jgi:putative ABC transport system permease protein